MSTVQPPGAAKHMGEGEPTSSRGFRAAKRGVARGTALQLGGTALTMALGFFTTPFFVHHLGTAGYGVYSLVLVFTFSGYFGYLDFGLQTAVVFRGAPHAARERWDEFSRVVSSALLVLAGLGLVFALCLFIAAPTLAHSTFDIPVRYQHSLVEALRVVALVILIQFPALAFVGSLQTTHRWGSVITARTIATLLGVGVALLLVWQTHDLLGLIIPVVAAPAVASVALVAVALRRLPGLTPRLRLASPAEARELFRYGRMIFVGQAGLAIVANLDQPLIAGFLSAHALGLYAIAATIYYGVFALMPITNSTVFAATSYLHAVGDAERLKSLTLRGARYAASVTLSAVAAAMVFGPRFIDAWVGRSYHESGIVLMIWLAHMPVTVFTGVLGNVLVAVGRTGSNAVISIASLVVNVPASVALVGPFGMRGVVLGTVIAYLVTGPVLIVVTLRAVGISARDFMWHSVFPSYAAGLVAAAVGGALLLAAHPSSLVGAAGAAVLTFLAGVAAAVALLPRAERNDLLDQLPLRRRVTGA